MATVKLTPAQKKENALLIESNCTKASKIKGKHGGQRDNQTGRPSVYKGETQAIRARTEIIPLIKELNARLAENSLSVTEIERIKQGNTESNNPLTALCLRCCYYSDEMNHCSSNHKLNNEGNCDYYKNVIQKMNDDFFRISELSRELSQYKPEEHFAILKITNSQYSSLKKYCDSKNKNIETGLLSAVETAKNADKLIVEAKNTAKAAEKKLENQEFLKTSNNIFQNENKMLRTEKEKLTDENTALKNHLKEYIECVHLLKTKNDKLELNYQDDIDFLTPLESYTYTAGTLNYLIVKNTSGHWFRRCTSIADKFSFDSHLTAVENDDSGFFMIVFDKRIDLKITTIKKLPSYCLKKYNANLNRNDLNRYQ
jgi:hypothetical protein